MVNSIQRILLGTSNPGKIAEMTALLDGLPLMILQPSDISYELEVEENGGSYLDNAIHKAVSWSGQSGLATLADDSGLEVDALDGAPGMMSHRFTGNPNASDADRRKLLIQRLQAFPRPWTARFKCSVAIAIPGEVLITGTGTCEGQIIPEERGTNGFGYDPIFLVGETGKTMAELSMDEKNRLSHRARAIESTRPVLIKRLLSD
jgi:XTP/dITP diphosphohydrolase